jgi:uncharacterized protein YukE
MADIIHVSHYDLQNYIDTLKTLDSSLNTTSHSLLVGVDKLRDDGWKGVGASRFYEEMDLLRLDVDNLATFCHYANQLLTEVRTAFQELDSELKLKFPV